MAISKRFLGLGFTFSATDKGLEKKLKSVSSLIRDINDSLKDMNKNSQSAGAALSNLSGGSSSVASGGSGTAVRAKRKGSAFERESKARKLWKVRAEKKSKKDAVFSDDSLKKIRSIVGNSKQMNEIFLQLADLPQTIQKKMIDARGDLTKFGENLVTTNVKATEEASSSISKMVNVWPMKFKQAVDKFTNYLKGVGSSINSFFHSVGFDINNIIPEQFKALGGVFNAAIIKPLLGIGSKLKDTLFKSTEDKSLMYQKQLNKLVKEGNQMTGGKSKGSMKSLLENIDANTVPRNKTKDSLFDFLSMLTAPLAIAAGVVVGIIGTFYKLYKVSGKLFPTFEKLRTGISKAADWIGELKYIKKIREYFSGLEIVKSISGWFSNLAIKTAKLLEWFKGFSFIGKIAETFTLVRSYLGVFGNTILEVGAKIFKFLQPLLNNPITKVMFGVGKTIGKVVTGIFLLYDVVTGLTKAFRESTGVIDFLGKAIWNVIDNILVGLPSFLLDQATKIFTSSGGSVFKSITDFFGNKSKSLGAATAVGQANAGTSPVSPFIAPPVATKNLGTKIDTSNKELVSVNYEQLSAMQKNNELMSQLISLQAKDRSFAVRPSASALNNDNQAKSEQEVANRTIGGN